MSRLAKYPVKIPQGIDFNVSDGGTGFVVKGPKGTIAKKFADAVKIEKKGQEIFISKNGTGLFSKKLLGTVLAEVKNAIKGVKEGFEKRLQIVGLGYQFNVQGKKLAINCGFAYPVNFEIPDGIDIKAESKTSVILSSADKQKLGNIAARIRKIRPPEPYGGKGIRYADEFIRKKVGKKAAVGSTVPGGTK